MGEKKNIWKKYWDPKPCNICSNYELDRGVSSQDKEMEQASERELFYFINPEASDFILDAGCGTGINLSRFNSKVTGLIDMDI